MDDHGSSFGRPETPDVTEDEFCSESDASSESEDQARQPTSYMHLITLVEVNVHGVESSKVLGVYTTKEKAIKAARFIMKRRSGCYPSTRRCAKQDRKDPTATVGDDGILFKETNQYFEKKTISLAMIPMDEECYLQMTPSNVWS